MEIKLLVTYLCLRFRTEPTEMTSEASIRQGSMHDAVPHGILCLIRCHAFAGD